MKSVPMALLLQAYERMCLVGHMADTYERNRSVCTYVHSTSRGHEAVQLAMAANLLPCDFVSPYYRDESLLLGLGFSPYELILQLLAKADDPFSGGREYYAHPSHRGEGGPTIIHQSSATGMQAIPTTGVAQGLAHLHRGSYAPARTGSPSPVAVCSLGDASLTEGEVSEAFQFAALHRLPILYLVQDNRWGISVTAEEARSMDAYEFSAGFRGMNRSRVDGADLEACHIEIGAILEAIRSGSGPWVLQADVPLLGHHTSGVRREAYRDDAELGASRVRDPRLRLATRLRELGVREAQLSEMDARAATEVENAFQRAVAAPEPDPSGVAEHVFRTTSVVEEVGDRNGSGTERIHMVDAAVKAVREIMEDHPTAVLYGQDVGRRLGGVFREAATLGEQFGDRRVFNTAIQEAYVIGSTAGMCAAGMLPIVEIQFADYIYPGLNQLVSELSKSSYLTMGKFPVQVLIRIPTGAYGGGGPYHSGSIESTLLTIKGIKVVYPSNAADMKGLMKAAFLDPNPVVMLEHKGLYWSRVPGTDDAKRPEPSRNYILPLGKAALALSADPACMAAGDSCCVVTYGMGVHWARAAATSFPGRVEIVDLRTLYPLDEDLVFSTVRRHGRCIVLTEDTGRNSFAEALAGRISHACFRWLDAPVEVVASLDLPAVPMNRSLEAAMLPGPGKVRERLGRMLED
jgi:2-oxoisovalerate dehydrogenase E1 component